MRCFFITIAVILCSLFVGLSPSVDVVYAQEMDTTMFCFVYEDKIWKYNAQDFIQKSKQFDLDWELNKYNKNGSKNDKKLILEKGINLGLNNSVLFEYIYPGITNKIDKIAKNIEKTEKNAKLIIKNDKNNKFLYEKEEIGILLDKNKFFDLLTNEYLHNNNDILIEIPVKKIMPEITLDMLKKETNFRSKFSTNISTSSMDRKHNIYKALDTINNTVLLPNQKFSFNDLVGRRTKDNGYREAKIISDGEFVLGVGGGVCQASTTLYNAVLKAGLKIISSSKHSQMISYVSPGLDAMVNFGTSDLIFENNTDEKIYIFADYSSSEISISIYGAPMNDIKYKLRTECIKTIPPEQEEIIVDTKEEYIDKVEYEDEQFYLKKAKDGKVIKSFRDTYKNEKLVSSELLRTDTFAPHRGVKVVGAKKRILFDETLENELILQI